MAVSPFVRPPLDHRKLPARVPRNLLAACLAHALHDGYTDALYVFLPAWQAQFGLSYAALAGVRALYSATMGGLQAPVHAALRKLSPRAALVLSTAVAAAGLLLMALPLGLAGLCAGLIVAGAGSSLQHPRGSLLVTDTYGAASRGPLGVYNFSGDLGKAALPSLVAALLPLVAWRPMLGLMAALGLVLAGALLRLAPSARSRPWGGEASERGRGRGGFGLLNVIGALDTASRMGYLLFLPFLVHVRGGGSPEVGVALALLFIGGALGKVTCGWVAQRLGVVATVICTEAATALLIVATLWTSLTPTLILLPLLGVMLNGTSSVLYGAVPDLAGSDKGRAFAVFYTSVIVSGGLAPIAYGALADQSSRTLGVLAAAATAAAVIPLVLALSRRLRTVDRLPHRRTIAS